MIILALATLGSLGAIAGLTIGITRAIEAEERYQAAALPPATETNYTLPMQWGGPPPPIEMPPDPGPILPGEMWEREPASPEAHHPITHRGSAVLVMREPEREPKAASELLDLLRLCPLQIAGTYSPDEFRLFSILKSEGRKQTEIIEVMYQAQRGGTDKYNRARDRYLNLLKIYLQTRSVGA